MPVADQRGRTEQHPVRIVITGLNGSGKSHFAQRISKSLPGVPLYSYDALRLTRAWKKRPAEDIARAVAEVVARDCWMIEGGPSLLDHALSRCSQVIWLDPPVPVRAWRLMQRPLRNFGQTRPELPDGNVDWPLAQYRFAARSLWQGRAGRDAIRARLDTIPDKAVKRCRTGADIDAAVLDLTADWPDFPR